MEKAEIAAKIKEGAVRVNTIIEIVGWPEEHVSKTLKLILDNIKKQKLDILKEEVAEPKKITEKAHSAFVELEMLFPNLVSVIGFIFDYMPSSIEILEPDKITENTQLMTDLMNDLIARLHQYDASLKQLKAINAILDKKLKEGKN